jgi:hypothetical protein
MPGLTPLDEYEDIPIGTPLVQGTPSGNYIYGGQATDYSAANTPNYQG